MVDWKRFEIPWRGGRIAGWSAGAGQGLVCLHGFPTSSEDWKALFKTVKKENLHWIAPNFVGFSTTDIPVSVDLLDISLQADLVERVLEYFQIENFHILAHDYGDTVAQELLARDGLKKRIQLVFLLNGGLFPETHKPLMIQKILMSPLGRLIGKLGGKKTFYRNLERTLYYRGDLIHEFLESSWQDYRRGSTRKHVHKLIGYMRERKVHRKRWVGSLENWKSKTILINGSRDPISGDHMIEHYLDIIGEPKACYRLKDCGHYPQIERATVVAQIIEELTD